MCNLLPESTDTGCSCKVKGRPWRRHAARRLTAAFEGATETAQALEQISINLAGTDAIEAAFVSPFG